jgi:hypothetical protein
VTLPWALSIFEPAAADSGVAWTDVVVAVATGVTAVVVLVTALFALRQLNETKKTPYRNFEDLASSLTELRERRASLEG